MSGDTTREFTEPLVCPKCLNKSALPIYAIRHESHFTTDESWPPRKEPIGDTEHIISECPSCDSAMLILRTWGEWTNWEHVHHEVLYPSSAEVPNGLPDSVRDAYTQALKAKSLGSELFGIALRRTLEMVCIDKGITTGTLGPKLKELATHSNLPPEIVSMATQTKDIGDMGAHDVIGALDDEETSLLEIICRTVLEYIYTSPSLVLEAQQRFASLKKPKSPSSGP